MIEEIVLHTIKVKDVEANQVIAVMTVVADTETGRKTEKDLILRHLIIEIEKVIRLGAHRLVIDLIQVTGDAKVLV